MNLFKRLLAIAALLSPIGLLAQSPVGTWIMQIPDGNGNMMALKVEISDKGTYTLDIASDGTIETKGNYTLDGDKMTIQDTEGTDCTEKGVYTIKVEGDTLTMTRVSDVCPNRGGPTGVMVAKKG